MMTSNFKKRSEQMNVFDFDETIYDGESSVQFILRYMREDPAILRFIPALIKVMARYYRGEIRAEDFLRVYAPTLRRYFETHTVDFAPLVREFWNKHEHNIKPFYRRIQRSDDVIITASPYFMMNDICARLGIKHLIATDFDTTTGEVHSACYREDKVRLFRAAFSDGEIDDFYTDSINDEFLFPLAKRVFMVKGNEIKQIK